MQLRLMYKEFICKEVEIGAGDEAGRERGEKGKYERENEGQEGGKASEDTCRATQYAAGNMAKFLDS